jgi:hypothetical protein
MVRSMLIVTAATVLTAAGGCVDMQEVRAMRDQAAQLRDDLRTQEADWERRASALPRGSPGAAEARAALAAARAKEAAVSAAVSAADAVLARANNPDEPLSQAAKGVAPLLPEPARTPVLLGAALVATLLRAAALKRGLTSVAAGLEKAMEEDDQFRQRFKAHANTFRTIQTRTARRTVDEVTGDRRVRLPV